MQGLVPLTKSLWEVKPAQDLQTARAASGLQLWALWLQSPHFYYLKKSFSFWAPGVGLGLLPSVLWFAVLLGLGKVSPYFSVVPTFSAVPMPSHRPPRPSLRCFSALPSVRGLVLSKTRLLGSRHRARCYSRPGTDKPPAKPTPLPDFVQPTRSKLFLHV